MRRIAIAAAKGGTGKTTTAVTLAHGLALAGQRVLLIDCDPRRDAALHFGLAPRSGLADWLDGRPASAVRVRLDLHVLDSGGEALAARETDLAQPGGASALATALDALGDFDVVVFDCPAGFGPLTRLAVAVCDEVVMPLAADYLSLLSAESAKRHLACGGVDGSPRPFRILPTFHDPGAATRAEVDAVLAELHAGRVFQTRIDVADALRDAPARRGTIFDVDPLSTPARQYAALVEALRHEPVSMQAMD